MTSKVIVAAVLFALGGCIEYREPAPAVLLSAPPAPGEPYCREFTSTVAVGGVAQPATGTACYRPDGSWEIVEKPPARPQQVYVVAPAQVYPYSAYSPYAYPPPPYYGPRMFVDFGVSFVFTDGHGHHHHGHFYPGFRPFHHHG